MLILRSAAAYQHRFLVPDNRGTSSRPFPDFTFLQPSQAQLLIMTVAVLQCLPQLVDSRVHIVRFHLSFTLHSATYIEAKEARERSDSSKPREK
jgi:hypothetical protein